MKIRLTFNLLEVLDTDKIEDLIAERVPANYCIDEFDGHLEKCDNEGNVTMLIDFDVEEIDPEDYR